MKKEAMASVLAALAAVAACAAGKPARPVSGRARFREREIDVFR